MSIYLLSLYLVLAYLVGNIMGGYIVGLFYHINLSEVGSGNVGSRNAGRVLGVPAFIVTALIDGGKGFFIVLLGKFWQISTTFMLLAGLLVIIGHIVPILFKFRGGQGIATLIGVMLAFNWWLTLLILLGIVLLAILLKSATLGFYITIIISSVAQLFINYMIFPNRILICFIVIVILVKSELENIGKIWHKLFN